MKRIFLSLWAYLGLTVGCSDKATDNAAPPSRARLGAPYNADLEASNTLVISESKLIGTKTLVGAADNSDVGLSTFEVGGLYELVKTHCGSCHAGQTKGPPFASPGVNLAYESIKPYLAENPDDSRIVTNIRGGHNGVAPDLAASFASKVSELAGKLGP